MMNIVKRLFNKNKKSETGALRKITKYDLRVATCALFVEMARIDGTFSKDEMDKIILILKDKYNLSKEHADALIEEADKELDESVDLWQFAKIINENCSTPEKLDVIETLWQIVYVDQRMDKYEHYLMNKLQNLLRLSHDQLIDAKLKVKRSMGL